MFLAETEQLIKEARGQQLTATQKLLSLLPQREQIPTGLDAHDLVLIDLVLCIRGWGMGAGQGGGNKREARRGQEIGVAAE